MTETSASTDTESRILAAAHRAFVRLGVAAARTQEIADKAGVNRALLPYHFRSNERLADAVFLRAAVSFFPKMLGTLALDVPLRDRLRAAIEMEEIERSPFLPGYILCELRAQPTRLMTLLSTVLPVEAMRARVLGSLQTAIDAEVEAGALRPTPAERLIVARMSMFLFPLAASHMIEVGLGLDGDAQAGLASWRRDELADFILRGFAA